MRRNLRFLRIIDTPSRRVVRGGAEPFPSIPLARSHGNNLLEEQPDHLDRVATRSPSGDHRAHAARCYLWWASRYRHVGRQTSVPGTQIPQAGSSYRNIVNLTDQSKHILLTTITTITTTDIPRGREAL